MTAGGDTVMTVGRLKKSRLECRPVGLAVHKCMLDVERIGIISDGCGDSGCSGEAVAQVGAQAAAEDAARLS